MKIYSDLRKQGFRLTGKRKAIFASINHNPKTMGQIYKEVIKIVPNIDLATVYRAVNFFVDKDLVQELDFADGKKRYERIEDFDHHHHLICDGCGVVKHIEIPNEKDVIKKVGKKSGFEIQRHILEFFGLCEKCQG